VVSIRRLFREPLSLMTGESGPLREPGGAVKGGQRPVHLPLRAPVGLRIITGQGKGAAGISGKGGRVWIIGGRMAL